MSREALTALEAAVQHLSNELSEDESQSGLVRAAVVVWEEMSLSEDGSPLFTEHYAACGDGSTPVTTAGLLVRGTAMVRLALDSWHIAGDEGDDEE